MFGSSHCFLRRIALSGPEIGSLSLLSLLSSIFSSMIPEPESSPSNVIGGPSRLSRLVVANPLRAAPRQLFWYGS